MSWRDWATLENEMTRSSGLWREVVDLDAAGPEGFTPEGQRVVSFASNDYLGLSQHHSVVEAAQRALERWGASAGAARLIVGSRPIHSELEQELAKWKRCDAALLFPTGFMTNLGVLSAFGGEGTLICSDELNHASIVDGSRLAKGRVVVYPHKDVDAVDRILKTTGRAIVVTDTVFSMDGDIAPVQELGEVCKRHGALLVLDEAHAVLGPDPDLAGIEVLRVGTLSKFLGSFGGFVAGPSSLIELLANRARPFIFTTATPPSDAAAALAALRVLRSPEGTRLKARLRVLIDRVRPRHPSPIIALVLGDENAALRASRALLERGILVPAIRPPSVPADTSRLRLTISAAHTDAHVRRLVNALADLEVAVGA